MAEGYADSGHIFSVDFNRKVIVYWWLSAMFTLTVSFIGIPLLIIWLPFGWLVHRKQFEHLACALTHAAAFRLGTFRCAGTATRLTAYVRRHPNLNSGTFYCIFQIEIQGVTKIGTTRTSGAPAATATKDIAKDISENITKIGTATETTAASGTLVYTGMAVTIIGGFFLLIR